jgi:hypothetical protein
MDNTNYIDITAQSLLSGHAALIKGEDLPVILQKVGKLCAVNATKDGLFLVAVN